jgi:heme oxygenase
VQIAFHSQGAPSPPLPATVAYTKRLTEVASKPLLLVAYAQTLYVALLAGGQTMAAFMRTARGLVKGQGDAIFDFSAGIPPAEHRRFRAALREAIDAMGDKLTGAARPGFAVS